MPSRPADARGAGGVRSGAVGAQVFPPSAGERGAGRATHLDQICKHVRRCCFECALVERGLDCVYTMDLQGCCRRRALGPGQRSRTLCNAWGKRKARPRTELGFVCSLAKDVFLHEAVGMHQGPPQPGQHGGGAQGRPWMPPRQAIASTGRGAPRHQRGAKTGAPPLPSRKHSRSALKPAKITSDASSMASSGMPNSDSADVIRMTKKCRLPPAVCGPPPRAQRHGVT